MREDQEKYLTDELGYNTEGWNDEMKVDVLINRLKDEYLKMQELAKMYNELRDLAVDFNNKFYKHWSETRAGE